MRSRTRIANTWHTSMPGTTIPAMNAIGRARDHVAAEAHLAARWLHEPGDGAQQRALARAVRARDAYHVALGLMPLGDDSATGRYLLESERRHPAEPRIQVLLAWLDQRRGHNQAALDRARRILRNDPDNTEIPPNLAELAVIVEAPDAERLIEPLARQTMAEVRERMGLRG